MQRTEISDLGEFALIRRLTESLPLRRSSSHLGVGDDAAVITPTAGVQTLLSSELFLEGIHFDLVYTPLKHLGYKVVVATLADIYAMGGAPAQLTVSLGISSRFSVEDVEALYSGVRLACEVYGVDLVGGDTSSSLTGLTIATSVVGEVHPDALLLRSGAQPNDLICVTGDLGAAYMGLQLLEREKRVFAGEQGPFTPDLEGYEYILERQLKPELNLGVLHALRERGIKPTAMIDVSDGLASELLHLAKQSSVGIRIYEERIPIDYQTISMAEALEMNATTVALSGGDDYEFLFTVPLGMMDVVREVEGVRFIGHVTAPELGCQLVLPSGQEIELRAQGWKTDTVSNH